MREIARAAFRRGADLYKRQGSVGLLLGLAFLWMLCVLGVYTYRGYDPSTSNRSGSCSFRPDFGPALKRMFEEGELAGFRKDVDRTAITYTIQAAQTTIGFPRLSGEDASRTILINAPLTTTFNTEALVVRFQGGFSPSEQTQLRGAITNEFARYFKPEHLNSCTIGGNSDSVSYRLSRLFDQLRLVDLNFHGVMLLLGCVLFYLLAYAWRGHLSKEDWPLAIVLATGGVTLFVLTRTAIGDHSLHFYNEAYLYVPERYGPAGPAYQTLLFRLFGMGSETLFAANRLLGLLTAVPLYLFMRDHLGGRRAGLAAALLLLTHPVWLRFSAGDQPYALAIFLTLSALVLLGRSPFPSVTEEVAGIAALSLAMLTRPEFAVLPLVAALVLGPRRIIVLFKERTRTTVFGMLGAILLLFPQYSMMLIAPPIEPGLVRVNLWAGMQALIGLHHYNSYLNLHWSPLTHIAITALGFAVLLFTRWRVALALFLCTGLYFWNDFIFQDAYFTLHYQLPAYPLYFMIGGVGLGKLLELCSEERLGRPAQGAICAVVVAIFCLPLANFPNLLQGNYTFMEQYRSLAKVPLRMASTCKQTYVHVHDLVNPTQVWFAEGTADSTVTPEEVMDIETDGTLKGCYYYQRTPTCLLNNEERARCERFEARFELKPIWEDTIRPLAAFPHETYLTDTVPIGIYKVTGLRQNKLPRNSTPVGALPQSRGIGLP